MNNDGGLTHATKTEEAVEEALQGDADLSRYGITVAVEGTNVSLSGEVGSEEAKQRAEHVASAVAGVLEVTNELVVVDRDASAWPFAGGRRRDTEETDTGAGQPGRFVGIAALGAANSGVGGTSVSGAAGAAMPMGAAGIGALAAENVEAAGDEGRDDTGGSRNRSDDV